MIAPSFALTAAHVVFDEKLNKLSCETSFTIGQTQHNQFLFQSNVSQIIIHPNYMKTLDNPMENKKWDLALLKFNNDTIGRKFGWASLKILEKTQKGMKIHISGYPAQKTFSSYLTHKKYEYALFDMEGSIKYIDDFNIYYDIDTSGGQSGSGLWNEMNGDVYCYGMHTHGFDGESSNRGVKITEEILSFLVEYINEI